MKDTLYIPKKIKVGYQKREDTYTKKLAYIIYYDDKGVLRKETSWKGWISKDIPVEEFDNNPQSGLILNKDIKRYNWGNFSSKRTMIRIYDPRGIEFEITTENLIGVLMNSDCSKRGLSGEFVYAWYGPELVLLPTNCEEYDKAKNYTKLQAGKITSKDLIPGCSYKTKRQEDFIYVGKYDWYKTNPYKHESRLGKKYYIFTDDDGKNFITKSSLEFLSIKNSDTIVSNLSDIIEKFQENIRSSKIIKWEVVPVQVLTETFKPIYSSYGDELKRKIYFKINGDVIEEWKLEIEYEYHSEYLQGEKGKYVNIGYKLLKTDIFDIVKQVYISNYSYYNRTDRIIQENELQTLGFGDLYVQLENGRRIKLDNLYNI